MISVKVKIVFLTFQVTYVLGRHSSCLIEAIRMPTHNICLCNENDLVVFSSMKC